MTLTAWECIGLVPQTHYVRKVGGRTLYEEVMYNDATSRSGDRVKLARLSTGPDGIREVAQWVHADTPVELVEARTGKVEPSCCARMLMEV